MGILKRIGAVIGILIECFILLFFAVYLGETISTFNEKIAAAYNSSYQKAYDPIYHTRYQEGYDEQYGIGYNEQHDVAYEEHYNSGYDEGYQSGLEIGHEQGLATRVVLCNPTYKELKKFLARDKTDYEPYLEGEYVCTDFAAEVNNNAELEGIRAAFVAINFPEERHAIVAFETIDKGIIFIEPQSDGVAEPTIGKEYWRCREPIPDYHYEKPSYDDTIVEIQIIW